MACLASRGVSNATVNIRDDNVLTLKLGAKERLRCFMLQLDQD